MKRSIDYIISQNFDTYTIRDFLAAQGFSSQNIILLKKYPEGIVLNGNPVYVNTALHVGDHLVICIIEDISSDIEAISLPLDIVYEDEDLLIVNKPFGMPTIPSMKHHQDSLANGVCAYYQEKQQAFIYRPVNRLDMDTTGLVLIAKHAVSASMLSAAIKNGSLHKTYTAIVSGTLPVSGTIDAPIARCDTSLISRCVNYEQGVHAVTHYQVLCQKEQCALVSIHLETGRTHQIRVHFSHIGHPLVGDALYGNPSFAMKRHALHADSLHFIQPLTGQEINCRLSLPDDMLSFWNHCS
jgi:23S rRNA pseudouridine1911/1915/1917 synthase